MCSLFFCVADILNFLPKYLELLKPWQEINLVSMNTNPTEYPSRSPDLTPMDFFLWGYLKDKVYCNKPRTIDALKLEIERQCRDIPNDMFCDVCESLGARYQRCLDNNGHQFEHLRT